MKVKIVKTKPPKGLVCFMFKGKTAHIQMSEQTRLPCVIVKNGKSSMVNFWGTAYSLIGEMRSYNISKVIIYCNHNRCDCCKMLGNRILSMNK